ncbi:MAG: DNA-processing protein DprA [Anaerolineales bacterium]|jgi:DNA processing protein
MDERLFWVGLNLVKGIGAVRLQKILDYFGDAQTAWEAPPTALKSAGLDQRIVDSLLQVRASVDLHAIWENIQSQEITLLTWLDEAYPRRLKEINQPPPVLYLRGEITPHDEWAVAIVGTRKYTAYGQQVAEEVAAFLARNGVTVVSGLARGIDSIAHQAALNAGGRSIGILGNGVDLIYPPENKGLAKQMMEKGAVMSDYPIGTPPESFNFPPRNRIISGLSIATVIIEAGQRSGALITAEFAVNQGREVFAVPGKITAPQSKGTNRLIREGAHPLLNPEDLMSALDLTMVTEHQTARTILPADATEAALFNVLGHEPKHVDEIGREVNLPIEQVSSTLALMELKGLVRQVGGMQYVAVREVQAIYRTDNG